MYTDIRGLLTFTHVDSVYVSVTVVPYVPLPLLRYDRATGVYVCIYKYTDVTVN